MDNFKFNFFSRGELGSLSIDNFIFINSKCYHSMSIFLVILSVALIGRIFSGNRLNKIEPGLASVGREILISTTSQLAIFLIFFSQNSV